MNNTNLTTAKCTHSFQEQTFTKADHVLGHKACLNKLQRTDIIMACFQPNVNQLEINNKKVNQKKTVFIPTGDSYLKK